MDKARDWRAVAHAAAATLDAARPGTREAALAKAADAAGIAVPTLRTFLHADGFLLSLPARLRATAEHLPPVVLETAARWYARDKKAAAAAIRGYARGDYTVRSFATAERAARPADDANGARVGRLKGDYRAGLRARLVRLEPVWPASLVADPPFYVACEAPDPSAKSDFMLRHDASQPRARPTNRDVVAAALIVGPYGEPRLYRARAKDWCLRALGLSALHDVVALLLPPAAAPQPFVDFMDMLLHASRARGPEGRGVDARVQILRDRGPPRG